jgi:hypothetical protein
MTLWRIKLFAREPLATLGTRRFQVGRKKGSIADHRDESD